MIPRVTCYRAENNIVSFQVLVAAIYDPRDVGNKARMFAMTLLSGG
jgi:hypothetical protein